jgi:Cu(I)/Ag(I) efflux system membrane fusion protein/cobalt-zinc-cadmium efflux system membrane fusion protein
MHPQVQASEPGRCPICGMNLVSKKKSQASAKPKKKAAAAPATKAEAAPKAKAAATPKKSASKAKSSVDHSEHRAAGKPEAAAKEHTHNHAAHAPPAKAAKSAPTSKTKDDEGHAAHPAQPPPAAPVAPKAKGERKIKYWVAPMDPNYRSDKPGKSPMGMDLVPVYEDGGSGSTLTIDPVVVQNMGVRTALVRRGNATRAIRTVGSIAAAEDRMSVINLRFSGWIDRIHVDETGVKVGKGQPLFDVYSPELVGVQKEYLIAVRTSGATSPLAKSAWQRLSYLGLPDWQIKKIANRGAIQQTLTITAPRAGYVIHKNAVQGARVAAGTDLYRIADLSKVWVEAEVYEFDAPWVALGSAAIVELTYQAGARREGEVSFVHPTLNERTRTLSVRIELANSDLSLKPGMFATVEIAAPAKTERVLIPTEAVIHSGVRELVFVARALGRYEAREIRTGVSGDNGFTEVLEGLEVGERVVTSGQFLLDSESQLREAVAKMLDANLHAKDPQAAAASTEGASEQKGGTYWTCSMHPSVVQDGPGVCPICGMDLVEKKR